MSGVIKRPKDQARLVVTLELRVPDFAAKREEKPWQSDAVNMLRDILSRPANSLEHCVEPLREFLKEVGLQVLSEEYEVTG